MKVVMTFKGTIKEFRDFLAGQRTRHRLQEVLNYDLARERREKQEKMRSRNIPRLKRSFPLLWE